MTVSRRWYPLILLGLILLLAAAFSPASARAPESPRPQGAAPAAPGQAWPGLLAKGTEGLEKEITTLTTRTRAALQAISQAQREGRKRRSDLGALKAALAVKSLLLPQAEAALQAYGQEEDKINSRLRELDRELETLNQAQTAQAASQVTLKEEWRHLLETGHPVARSREINKAYQRYQQLATRQQAEAARLRQTLERQRQLLEKERLLLADTRAELKEFVELVWKEELLKRQAPRSFWERVARTTQTLVALPEQGYNRLAPLYTSGVLVKFFRDHLAIWLGLLASLLLLGWGARRGGAWANNALLNWQGRAQSRIFKALLHIGQTFLANLFLLGLIIWLGLALGILGLWPNPVARSLFYLLITLVAWRLGSRLVQVFFAGGTAGGLLPLDDQTARFYRRSLKVFLAYVFLGLWGLKCAEQLNLPAASGLFLRHLFGVGFLGWGLWLLRRPYLAPLLSELPGPAWLRRLEVMRLLRGLVLILLSVIILADLLGFQNLATYMAEAGALTAAALLLLWLLYLGVDRVLHHLLHPERGWAIKRYPQQAEILQRFFRLADQGVTVILVAVLIMGTLWVWGLETEKLLLLVNWLNWGPKLGYLRLTPLNLALTVLVLYLGFWGSRFARSLLEVHVFPRTEWDTGIQYTISTSLHYLILTFTILLALSILGFPLFNLALVAGGLGVGLGFGLQNIVNNFLSGLILLFERPIKVGDLLVIDGQWGHVKEIRVRSTVFETFDRYVLIIPNSELLSGKILNWTHYGRGVNRLTLKVGVSYGADVRLVTRIIEEVCRANPRVVAEPPPQVFFEAYGDSSLNFNIWVHLGNPGDRIPATHELNTAIFEAFQQHGIEIPFPQRDLHLKSWPSTPGGAVPPPPVKAE